MLVKLYQVNSISSNQHIIECSTVVPHRPIKVPLSIQVQHRLWKLVINNILKWKKNHVYTYLLNIHFIELHKNIITNNCEYIINLFIIKKIFNLHSSVGQQLGHPFQDGKWSETHWWCCAAGSKDQALLNEPWPGRTSLLCNKPD